MKHVYSLMILCVACSFYGCVTDINTIGSLKNEQITIDEAPDCLDASRCPYYIDKNRDVYTLAFEGNLAQDENGISSYVSTIDKQCHQVAAGKWGGDMDYFSIHAEPGTAIKVRVERTNNSNVRPVVSLFSEIGGELIYAIADEYGRAALSYFVPEKVTYVRIEEYYNYNISFIDTCSEYLLGGNDYKYHVIVENIEEPVTSFGVIMGEKVFNGKKLRAGDVQYYKFSAPSILNLEAEIVITDGTQAAPAVVQIDRNSSAQGYAGGYQWIHYSDALNPENNSHQRILDRAKAECSMDYCDYWIAVTDYRSVENYDYQIKVRTI